MKSFVEKICSFIIHNKKFYSDLKYYPDYIPVVCNMHYAFIDDFLDFFKQTKFNIKCLFKNKHPETSNLYIVITICAHVMIEYY